MRLSTKTRYGVRAIFDIAYHGQDQPGVAAQAKDIARREDIPLRYLEQIFQDLKRAGLVESKRGPRGGYSLKRSAEEITLGDVVRALQGPIEEMFVVEDTAQNSSARPRRARQSASAGAAEGSAPATELGSRAITSRTVTVALWRELATHVSQWFDSVSISDLVLRGEELGLPRAGAGQPMYYI
ncbi:RrF2 family transcriptional regulator [Haliangium ochraceum]|uniref:Transcriptional regulator, BadM/Rrf2 family n=1 Tax=Haliangium ochraceum (strain DSM 14365 / JCM 11303 / SMP-2) TaxID=502025 RepID=D0LKV2_HALO1|nr:Rrf2 family transcriptional regulator [Haliangium ochraceum]ACY16672.1 transcriptional regulator, BadM/Rrf2 family [Haliangium ochraceum DSM 14365]